MERGVAQQLQKNLATLKADRGKVITTNTLSFLSQPGTPHQIVFVDPPFRQGLLEETLRLLETQGWLADEALVYVESEVEKRAYRRCRLTGNCIVKKWPDRSPTVFTNVRPKESTMLINLGRLLMLCVWAFLLLNLFSALPEAAEYLCQRRADFHDPDARSAADAAQGDAAERGAAAEPL